MNKAILLTTLSLLLSKTVANVIPNNDLIKLPLIKKLVDLEKRSTHSEGYELYNEERTEYLTKIYIGTPPQEFYVSIDTGSADIWVPSTSCPSTECPLSKFQHKKSSSYQAQNISFAIQYGSGSIAGEYAKEKINLLGPTSKLTIESQIFGLAHSAADNIISTTRTNKMTSNGILGLAFPALTANSDTVEAYNPFVFNLAAQKLISKPVFSIYLGDINAKGWSGELAIGGINNEKYSGNIQYVPVVKNINPKTTTLDYTFWSVDLQHIKVNNTNVDLSSKENKSIMLDTGTTLSYLTKEMVDQIVRGVTQQQQVEFDQESELYIVDCNLKTSNKKVEIAFKTQDEPVKLQVDVQDLILPLYGGNKNECGFGITYNFDKDNTLVFGDTVLRSAYFVFDMQKKRIGMATAVNSKSKVSL